MVSTWATSGTTSERVRKPWAIGPPNGLSFFARSTSRWIHWWSAVASANLCTASCVTSYQSLVPSSVPTSPGSSARVVVVVMRVSSVGRADVVPRNLVLCPRRRAEHYPAPTTPPRWPSTPRTGYHWTDACLDRRLGDLRPGPPPLGPGGRGRSAAPPGRRAGARGAAAAPGRVVAPRRHLGDAGRCVARGGAG